jgi:hypothetical protein
MNNIHNFIKFLLLLLFSFSGSALAMAELQIDMFKSYEHPRFNKFKTITEPRIEHFVLQRLKMYTPDSSAVFYPFGGPDLVYPLTLFPQARSYLLIGLEPAGSVTDLQIPQNLNHQLDSLFRRSFFVTADMGQAIPRRQGVLPLFLAQIALKGGLVKDIKNMDYPFGKLLEITFTHLQVEKKLIYVQANVENQGLKEEFTEFIRNNNLFDTCLIKASSYALHQNSFSKLRNFILMNANVILQDDTGVPLKKFPEDFEIHLFGNYTKPYGKEWTGYFQKDLRKMYDDMPDKSVISFCYGYGCGRSPVGLLLAIRKTILN